MLKRHLVGCQGGALLTAGTAGLAGGQRCFQEGERCTADKNAVGGASHDGFGIGRDDPRRLDAVLTAAEEIDQVLELNPLGKTVLLLRLTNAGERQRVEQLGRHARAAAAGGHCHRRMQAGSRHVTAAGMKPSRPMNKSCEKLGKIRFLLHG